jgi:hypothetical protein
VSDTYFSYVGNQISLYERVKALSMAVEKQKGQGSVEALLLPLNEKQLALFEECYYRPQEPCEETIDSVQSTKDEDPAPN